VSAPRDPEQTIGGPAKRYRVHVGAEDVEVALREVDGKLLVSLGSATHRVDVAEVVPGVYSLVVDGRCHDLNVAEHAAGGLGARRWNLTIDGEACVAEVGGRSRSSRTGLAHPASHTGEVRAPMPGLLVALHVSEGAEVALGQPVIILEAMKMQMEIRAPHAGTVRQVHVAPGQEVAGGQLLVTID